MTMDTVKISDMAWHNEKARLVFVPAPNGVFPAIVLRTKAERWTRTLLLGDHEPRRYGWL